jgi:type I restriction enzyme M protein
MATKKSELYSSLWAGCDALRGSMDPQQYKDYVLVLLFLKYISDKSISDPKALIEIPAGCYYADISALKGKKDVGEQLDKIIGKIAEKNDLQNVIDVISFNDDEKLGKGKDLIDKVSDLIAIFENSAFNFGNNRADGDDLLGDAYEFLMRHFASESGKSKGEFYTPAEVSRVLSKVLGIKNVTNKTKFYDCACGSGSLLLKAIEEAGNKGTIFGQELSTSTAALAKMNMIIHDKVDSIINYGYSTLSKPSFTDKKSGGLETFDYIVANPPFSLSNWTNGFNPFEDEYQRFGGYGIPPEKNGDYAFLLHIVKSLKSDGKAAVILPHGVLFRGGSEGTIRTALIKKGFIKGIIGLPANLFYGTGIPACIIVIDKEDADNRECILMMDASKGFMKDGNKNRLREQDIHKIVDAFTKQEKIDKYSRLVPISEISDTKNDYNLNIPRYIDSQDEEDLQDISAHLLGDIPDNDIDALKDYWKAYPSLRTELFGKSKRKDYSSANVSKDNIKHTIFNHPEFTAFTKKMDKTFADWKNRNTDLLKALKPGLKPKQLIKQISEDLLGCYAGKPLLDNYDVYQHIMNYWNETMQDDSYIIALDGWKAEPYRIIEKNKKTGKETDKGWTCDLVPPSLVIDKYFPKEKKDVEKLQADKESLEAELQTIEEEHNAEGGLFAAMDKVNKVTIAKRLKESKNTKEEIDILNTYLKLVEDIAKLNADIKKQADDLDKKTLAHYKKLSVDEIKTLVVDDKWMNTIAKAITSEMDRVSQTLTQRIKELYERYEAPLPQLNKDLASLEKKVNAHLEKMGLVWN